MMPVLFISHVDYTNLIVKIMISYPLYFVNIQAPPLSAPKLTNSYEIFMLAS